MRFNSYFEQDFLINEHISLSNVICNENTKTFKIVLKGEKLLEINALKKLILGMQKLSSDRQLRKYEITYSIAYNDLRKNESKLYLEYYRTILTEVSVDYELLSLSNSNVAFDGVNYVISLSDINKVNDNVIEKAKKLFTQFGLDVDIKKELIDKETILEIKKEILSKNNKVLPERAELY